MSCIDKIEFDNIENNKFLVVDTRIVKGANIQKILFSETAELGDFQESKINPEEVRVVNGAGNTFNFSKVVDGEFISTFQPSEGVEYRLEFSYNNIDYTSNWERLPSLPQIDTFYYEFERETFFSNGIEQERRGYHVFAKLNPSNEAKYFRWAQSATYELRSIVNDPVESCAVCFSNVNFPKTLTVDRQNPNQQEYTSEITYLPYSDKFSFLYRLRIKVSSLSEQAFQYYKSIETILNQSGSVFDPTPFQVQSNIRSQNEEDVYGFFFLSNEASHDVFIRRFGVEGLPTPFTPVREGDCLTIYPFATCNTPENWPNGF